MSAVAFDRAAWLEERRHGIGGSDAPVIAGLSPWKTPLKLYLEKRGEVEPDDLSDNEAVHFGNVLEDTVANEYARRTGRKVQRVNRILRHRDHPFMIANVDRLIVGEDRGLECKTVGTWAARNEEEWGPANTDLIPPQYLIQCQHYMGVTGRAVFDLAALIGGQELRIYTIPRDEQIINGLIIMETGFWGMVERGDPPLAETVEDARMLWRRSSDRVMECAENLKPSVRRLVELADLTKQLELEEAGIKARVMSHLGDADTLAIGGRKLLTWKSQTTRRFNEAAFKAAHPDIHAEFVASSEFRRFCLAKGAKEL